MIVGAGGTGVELHLKAYLQIQDVEVVGICDPDIGKASLFGGKYGIGHAFPSLENALGARRGGQNYPGRRNWICECQTLRECGEIQLHVGIWAKEGLYVGSRRALDLLTHVSSPVLLRPRDLPSLALH